MRKNSRKEKRLAIFKRIITNSRGKKILFISSELIIYNNYYNVLQRTGAKKLVWRMPGLLSVGVFLLFSCSWLKCKSLRIAQLVSNFCLCSNDKAKNRRLSHLLFFFFLYFAPSPASVLYFFVYIYITLNATWIYWGCVALRFSVYTLRTE